MVSVFRLLGRKDLFFDGIQAILKAAFPDADIQDEIGVDCPACRGTETIIIVDTATVEFDGLVAEGRTHSPGTRILAVCDSHSLNDLIACLAKGAQGCVLRRQTAAEFVDAIRRLSEGQVYLPNSIVGSSRAGASRPVAGLRRLYDEPDDPSGIEQVRPSGHNGMDLLQTRPLSGRQKSVMVLMARGMTNKAIARELSLAEGTVKVHVNNVFKQLHVNNRVQAIAKLAQFEFQKLGGSVLMFLTVGVSNFMI